MLGVKGGTVRGWLSQQRLRPRQGREALIGAMGNQELERKERTGGKLIPFSLRERLCELKGARLSVWLCHWLHSDKQGLSWPSLELLAKETGLDKGWIVRARACLRKNGWLVQESNEQPRRPNNRFAVARYFVRIPLPIQRKSATEKVSMAVVEILSMAAVEILAIEVLQRRNTKEAPLLRGVG